uniref:BTB domain-containing protein n=1 Tax=Panagrolaimus superbus TaxID=310955 RepID=A0A914Y7P1_9BILA
MKDLDQIKLNVGGHKFETSADTLKTCESFFSTLVTSDIPQKVDADNYVFIDRNGVNFGKILDFMRMRTIDFGHNIELAKAIRVEADFYQFQVRIIVGTH